MCCGCHPHSDLCDACSQCGDRKDLKDMHVGVTHVEYVQKTAQYMNVVVHKTVVTIFQVRMLYSRLLLPRP